MSTGTATPWPRRRWTTADGVAGAGAAADLGQRLVAEEAPVAIVHDGSTTAVMMATPADLEDFAVGFTLTEGLVGGLDAIRSVEVVQAEAGIEARVWLAGAESGRLAARRRRLAGATGCGLCGIESLEEAARPPRRVEGTARATATELLGAMEAMSAAQALGRSTRAAHAAGLWREGRLVAVREDVGRHNALDKLAGAVARAAQSPDGVVLLTSRVSVEMVQKAAALGAPILCAVSAPTTLAIRTAELAGLTLVAVCRADGFEVFTHPERIELT